MTNKIHHSRFGQIMDEITFPLRALFMLTEGKLGLSSLREERMRVVASFCKGRVLDIGCGPGNLFIKNYIGRENGMGVDVFVYDGVETVIENMTNIPFHDCSFDTITLIAVGGHIPKSMRAAEFREFARLLKPEGILVMTEGEPITQFLVHQWEHFYLKLQGKIDMDSERGMAEDEEFCMPRKELLSYLNTPPLSFVQRKRFMWGLNNVYMARKENSD